MDYATDVSKGYSRERTFVMCHPKGTFHQIHNGESAGAENPGDHKAKREAELEAKNIKFDFNFVLQRATVLLTTLTMPKKLGRMHKHFRLRRRLEFAASGAISANDPHQWLRQTLSNCV